MTAAQGAKVSGIGGGAHRGEAGRADPRAAGWAPQQAREWGEEGRARAFYLSPGAE